MDKIKIKHEMDTEVRMMTLNEGFLEALQLSESRSSDIEKQEYALFDYLSHFPQFISNISDEYKKDVLKSWDYKIIN